MLFRYFHRSLNIPKLVDVKFTYIPRNTTLARLILRHKLPAATSLKGLREMEEKDIPGVKALWERYVTRFKMHPQFTEDELQHNLLSGRGSGEAVGGRRNGQVVWSYVVEVRLCIPYSVCEATLKLPHWSISGVLRTRELPRLQTSLRFTPSHLE